MKNQINIKQHKNRLKSNRRNKWWRGKSLREMAAKFSGLKKDLCTVGKHKENKSVQNKDGRVVECGTHLLPQIHQKYIYKWNNSHRTPTARRYRK